MTTALQLEGLRRHYGSVRAVDGVDLCVDVGQRFALLGPSGSGKTTILRLIAGFEQPDAGRILLGGGDVAGLPPERRNVGVVFQDYALFPHRTVRQNIEFGLRMRRVDRSARRRRVGELLDLVGLQPQADRRPDQLSGGQRQRVALARALAPEPNLLLLDEPLANLDRRLRESLREELVAITDAVDITTILVTHDQEEALSFAGRIGVLRDGALVQVGTPTEVWQAPVDGFVAQFLGDMNLVVATPRGVDKVAVAWLDRPLGVRGTMGEGSLVACLRPEALAVAADPDGPGTVTGLAYAGGTVTYRVQVASEVLAVREQRPDGQATLDVGAQVRLTPLVDEVAVLSPSGSA